MAQVQFPAPISCISLLPIPSSRGSDICLLIRRQIHIHTEKKKNNKTAIPHTGVGLFSDACTCKRARSTLVHQAALAWKHTFGLSLVLYQGEQTHVYISWRKTTMIILNRISELAVSFLWASPQFAKAVFSLLFLPLQVWSHTSNSSRGALLWV